MAYGFSCDNGYSCSRSDLNSDFECSGSYATEGTTCISNAPDRSYSSGQGSEGNCHYIGLNGAECKIHDIFRATHAQNTLNDTSTPINQVFSLYHGPGNNKTRWACAAEHIQRVCLHLNETHMCYQSGHPEPKLSDFLQRMTENAEARLKTLETQFGYCMKPNVSHMCYRDFATTGGTIGVITPEGQKTLNLIFSRRRI